MPLAPVDGSELFYLEVGTVRREIDGPDLLLDDAARGHEAGRPDGERHERTPRSSHPASQKSP